MSKTLINIAGQRFGKLLALRLSDDWQSGQTRWLCRCDCGQETTVRSHNLRYGKTKSCGCAAHPKTPRPSNVTNNNPKPHPIGLSDIQNEILADFVHRLVPVEWRERFYASTMDELMARPSRTDAVLLSILYCVKDRLLARGRKGNAQDDEQLEQRLA